MWSTLRKKHHEEDDLSVTHRIGAGTPAKVIQKVADDVKADLLVIGPSDSRSKPVCWWTATTFNELVHQTKCPLLVVWQNNESPTHTLNRYRRLSQRQATWAPPIIP